ncbi:unnamed protein product [Ceutorhynchus assimilis]|uniref:Uncharacterized protein n=1 Tax=Ceutorhynchus assimilis TaxID=467358 RepID=A0A9N9MEZ0_9CUCU|nr:unnamed protein product [Ceutorhynchus assimilis]
MAILYDANNEPKMELARDRRQREGFPEQDIEIQSRICLNCNRSIINELEQIQHDPRCVRINVLKQTRRQSCLICDAIENLHRLSVSSRAKIYIAQNIYVPNGARSYIYRAYLIPGEDLQVFLEELRILAARSSRWIYDENSLSDEDFQDLSGLTKEQYQHLFTFCNPVLDNGQHRLSPTLMLLA